MKRQAREAEYDFVLVLDGVSALTAEVEDALFDAGCDDATLSLRSGRVYLTFSRQGSSLKDAILRAVHDVRSAGIGADVLRVDYSTLVTQSDIARKLGRSRQLVHQYINAARGPGGFPAPVSETRDGGQLWCWGEVAAWLADSDMIRQDVRREAEEVEVINSVLELEHQRRTRPELTQEVLRAVEA